MTTFTEIDLETRSGPERVQWVIDTYSPHVFLSSSFGAQAAVLLHMVTKVWPAIPVVLVDTGYLFPETYQFIDEMTSRLNLNLKTYRAALSPSEQEAKYGKLWEQGLEGLSLYNQMNKVEPLERAIAELKPQAWIAGLRREQAQSRESLSVVSQQRGLVKVLPIVDWSNRDVFRYLKANDLPYHPLYHKGYVSIGDIHTTRPITEGMREEETRFFGLKRECGLHEAK